MDIARLWDCYGSLLRDIGQKASLGVLRIHAEQYIVQNYTLTLILKRATRPWGIQMEVKLPLQALVSTQH